MKVEIDVKFNIGDKVIVKETSGNGLHSSKQLPIKAVISGYVITRDTRRTTVSYLIEAMPGEVNRFNAYSLTKATAHRRRYPAKWLEKVE